MSDDSEALRERAELLATIARYEREADWTPLEELQERAEVLDPIAHAEEQDG